MKIFILEDDPERILWLRERLIGHECTFVESCTQFDQFQPPYDLILLDHDLGGRQLEEHEDNGETFARRMVDSKLEFNCPIILHSYNPDGARNQDAILTDHMTTRAPFRGSQFNNILDALLLDGKSSYSSDFPSELLDGL